MSSSIALLFTAVKELGLQQLGLYAAYQVGLRSGLFRLMTKPEHELGQIEFQNLMPVPSGEQLRSVIGEEGVEQVIHAADMLLNEGLYALFGGQAQPLELALLESEMLQHWTVYERGKIKLPVQDIKFLWEPARLGWAFLLVRAYLLTGEIRYQKFFWEKLQFFLEKNPPMLGPNWSSGQEVGIRIMVMVWAGGIFLQDDPDAECHSALLSRSIAEHARRIPPTLMYARSQHNNHLITEALGLLCAGLALPSHEKTQTWRQTGIRWLNDAFEKQIAGIGEYAQHSMNYHRLMLQCACLTVVLLEKTSLGLTESAARNLREAATWLAAEVDGCTGEAAVYGNNDGAYLYPVDIGGFGDYRMTAQATGRIFLKEALFPAGYWDEFSLWLGLDVKGNSVTQPAFAKPNELLKLGTPQSWARMRSNYFTSRPAHADQLHVDLWWKGRPIALDAGTFLYNGKPPWDNQLAGTSVHNTVTVDGLNQMRRVGRFLWLDWAQACTMRPDPSRDYIQGEHNGYRQLSVMHRRRLECLSEFSWLVQDTLYQPRNFSETKSHEVRLHWLLPDGEWALDETRLFMTVEQGRFFVDVAAEDGIQPHLVQLCRAGEVLSGGGSCAPQAGWYSPLYGEKYPAISFSVTYLTPFPITILSKWQLSG